jgi:hypothetical protein
MICKLIVESKNCKHAALVIRQDSVETLKTKGLLGSATIVTIAAKNIQKAQSTLQHGLLASKDSVLITYSNDKGEEVTEKILFFLHIPSSMEKKAEEALLEWLRRHSISMDS